MSIPDFICGVGVGVGYTIFFGGMVTEEWREIVVGAARTLFGAVCTVWL